MEVLTRTPNKICHFHNSDMCYMMGVIIVSGDFVAPYGTEQETEVTARAYLACSTSLYPLLIVG